MARIISENSGKSVEVADGDMIKYKCEEELDVPFGCKQGICGTCRIQVIEGMENLSEKNEKEIDMGLGENERLACQTKINKGEVRIRF